MGEEEEQGREQVSEGVQVVAGRLGLQQGRGGGQHRQHGHGMAPVAMVGPVEEGKKRNFTQTPLAPVF